MSDGRRAETATSGAGPGWAPLAFVVTTTATVGLAALAGIGPDPAHLILAGIAIIATLRAAPARRQVDPPASVTAAAELIAAEIETLKDAAWELGERELRYRDLLDAQSEVIVRRDTHGRITYANRAFCKMFGLDSASAAGSVFQPDVLPADEGPAWAAGPGRRTDLMATASGPRWIEWVEHTISASGGREMETQCVGRDVTDQIRADLELAQARDDAQAASRAKSRFLAAMSHEIRTPMSGIMGMAALLLETDQRPDQRTYTEAIDTSARTLLALIDEILDFSKIEAGRLELNAMPFSVAKCVQNSVELLAPRAHDRGLEIAWTIEPSLPALIQGDEARLRQILLNLIGNAVKFTDRGGIMVEVSQTPPDAPRHRAVIRIKDTGIGVSPQTAERLFVEFSQSDAPEARERGGTGLGLAISRRLARAMGGDIRLDSAPGRGATFTVEIELRAVEGSGPVLSTPAPGARRPRVALVLDRPIERRALAATLRATGIAAVEVELADEGLDPVEADLVILDGAIGLDAAREQLERLRGGSGAGKSIVLLDSQSRQLVDAFRAAGFDSYLIRPVRPQSLLAVVAGASAAADEHPDALVMHRSPELSLGLRVLLAEDNPINALLAERMLGSIGCRMVHVTDGLAAIEAVEQVLAGRERPYDLILMDVHMPRLDGLQAASALRRLRKAVSIPPIIALTANAFPEDRAACLEAGYDDYVSKPFGKDELIEVLKRWSLTAQGEAA